MGLALGALLALGAAAPPAFVEVPSGPAPGWHLPVNVAAPVPPPPPPAAPAPVAFSGMGSGCASGPVHDLIVAAFAPLGEVDEALYIATRESGCNPNARNPTPIPPYGNASGVFQILAPGIWELWESRCGIYGSVFDAATNVAVAACTVADEGWGPWAL